MKKAMRKGYTIDPALLILIECGHIKFATAFEIEELRDFSGKYHLSRPRFGQAFHAIQ